MKLNLISTLIFLGSTLLVFNQFAYADDWSSDDWGQWVNEEMTQQQFSNDAFDQLNQLDGIKIESTSKKIDGKNILPNVISFQLWQLENGHQYVDIDQLSNEEKAQYMLWLDQSDNNIDVLELDIESQFDNIEPEVIDIKQQNNNQTPVPNSPVIDDNQIEFQYENTDLELELDIDITQQCDDPNHYHRGDYEFYYHDNVDQESN
ncbi:MAG: hypothetical protein HRU38_15915 [Saccharospirillaceae bacterium]|nr:hypothetical protein [Pseudomonadales bacterium]NRB80128.1 hypothetical protein [Saccharospirillaceae bacterium]